MNEVIKSLLIEMGYAVDATSQAKAEKSVADYEKAVVASEAKIAKAKAEGAKASVRYALEVEAGQAREALEAAKTAAKVEEAEKRKAKAQAETAQQARTQMKVQADMIGWATVKAQTFARVVEAVTRDVAGYVVKVSAALEQMAYAADRTNTSVRDLKTYAHSVGQLGGSAGQALNDLENFAAKFRSNPQGYTGFLKSVGVDAYDASGKLKSFRDMYREFREQVGKKPYEQQLLYAQEIGYSEQTWRASDPTKMAEEEARSRAKYARMGYDPDKAAQDAKGLEHALRDMFESLSIIGEKTVSKIFADMGDSLKGFTTFLEQHGDQITEVLSKIAQLVLAVSKALLEFLTSPQVKSGLDWLLGMFGKVDDSSGKWVANTEKIKDAMEALAVFIATIFVAKITGAFAAILKELGPLLTQLAPILALSGLAYGANSNGILTGPEGSRSIGEGVLRTLEPGWADRRYGKTERDKAADAKDDRTLWQRIAPKALGGRDAPIDPVSVKSGGGKSEKGNYNFTGENADVLRQAAKELGTSPEDLATVISYESKFNPGVWGGKGGNYMGLIQFGPNERRDYGANDKQSFAEQMPAVVRFLKDRKFKPGMGLMDLYSTINAGSPGLYDRSDGYGTVRSHSEKMRITERERVEKFLNSAPANPAPAVPNLQEAARAMQEKAAAVTDRLDKDKLQSVGAATQNFRPEDYFKTAPPIGSNTTNDNSTRNQSYKGGDTNVTINTHGDVRETADLWRRHGERQKADDLRHAASIFAA